MQHVAIDLGAIKSQLCVREADGTIVVERSSRTLELPALLASLPPSRVILESCAEAVCIGRAAKEAGHDVRVVPATLVHQLGVGYRGIKTDRRDAEALSLASCRLELPSIHQRSALARERQNRLVMRHALVTARTQLVNVVRGWLRIQLLRIRGGTAETFPRRMRALSEQSGKVLPEYVEDLLKSVDTLTAQIARSSAEIEKEAKSDALCRRLMSVPGVGPITATAFVSTVDEIGRFAHAEALESYVGLTPGENSSSQRVRRTGITKAGPTLLRHVITQAALVMRRTRPLDPAVQWSEGIRVRRGKQIAVIALSRKLVRILYALWRDGTTYEPKRAAASESERRAAA